ncbi:MAG: hypothetical protein K8F27_14790 [Sulfuricellaceae bacterium]|nr:hypothetical protein [Sulfuricellaceae bacterium]
MLVDHSDVFLSFVDEIGINTWEPIIDVGNRSADLLGALMDRDYRNLSLLNPSAPALGSVQMQLGLRATRVKWYCHEIDYFTVPHSYRLWHDGAVFLRLRDEAERKRYLSKVEEALHADGHLILGVYDQDHASPESATLGYSPEALRQAVGDSFDLQQVRRVRPRMPGRPHPGMIYGRFVRKAADT